MFGLFKQNAVPRERRLKLHDVEAWLHDAQGNNMSGKLWQTRWSDGTGKFRVMLPKIREGWTPGTQQARLMVEGREIAAFALQGRSLDFKWRGEVTEGMPKLEIGQQVRVEVGSLRFEGTVEAD